MRRPERPNAVFEIAVPNGIYRVHLVSGDPSQVNSVFRINVEGVLVVNATLNGTPTSGHPLDRDHSHRHRQRRPPDRQ